MRCVSLITLPIIIILVAPMAVGAQVSVNPSSGTTFGLGTADLESTVVNVVQWRLAF